MKVNVISESAFTVQGHGVHTAFTETVDGLKEYTDCDVKANTNRAADIIHIHTIGPYSLKKLVWGKGAKVVSAHVTPDSFVGSLVGAKYWYGGAKLYLRWFYNRADGVLAVSSEVQDELKAMGVTAPVYLAPNTIRTEVFHSNAALKAEARRRLGLDDKAFIVLGCGQVQPRKRIDCFVRAAKALPALTFVWVGGIPFKQLAAESADMGKIMHKHPQNMIFTDMIERPAVFDWYRAADLFFLPSDQETFGLVVVEAAAASLPILLRDLHQYAKTFAHGYEKGDDQTFSTTIDRFAHDKIYYELWKKAAGSIAQSYDARVGAKRLVEIYRDVIKNLQTTNGAF